MINWIRDLCKRVFSPTSSKCNSCGTTKLAALDGGSGGYCPNEECEKFGKID